MEELLPEDAGNDGAGGFAGLLSGLPVRIRSEGLPHGFAGLAARIAQQEVQALVGRIGRHPVANALDTVLLEEPQGVVAETVVQGFGLAGMDGVNAQLVYRGSVARAQGVASGGQCSARHGGGFEEVSTVDHRPEASVRGRGRQTKTLLRTPSAVTAWPA